MPLVEPTADQRWVEVAARVPPADVDAVADALREAGAEGVAIEPAILVSDAADFQYEELDAPSLVRATFPALAPGGARRALRRRLNALALGAPLPRLRFADVGAHLWAEEWKRFYHVQHIGTRLVVRPSWEPYDPRPHEVVVELDPGTAFGTGQHETTRLCLEAIEQELPRRLSGALDVLDVGAGSGILAIAAALLGARTVRAIDNDPETVAIAAENARLNGVGNRIAFAVGSMSSGPTEGAWPWPPSWSEHPPRACCDLLVSNISSTAVIAMLPAFARAIRPGGTVILSGFIARDADEVSEAARAAGLLPDRVTGEAEWRCLVARAPR